MNVFKIQTSRKNFLLHPLHSKVLATGLTFLFTGLVSISAHAEISRCESMFESVDLGSTLEAASADSFWLRASKVPTADAFGEGVVFELGKAASEQAIYRRMIAPALWSYARLAVEHRETSDPVTTLINRIERQVRIELSRDNPRRNDHVRPKVMTRAERDEANALGHYGMIDGARLTSPKSDAQKKREAFETMILQAKKAYGGRAAPKGATDPVRTAFEQFQRWHVNDPMIAMPEIEALLADPTDFAIVYAQQQGLAARFGKHGEMLSALVPWMRPVQSAEKFRILSDMVALARALNIGAEAEHSADILVLEVLRQAFAPHLREFLP